jgi:hypothetical protein
MNPLRRHYLSIAQERIDEQIAELKTRRADIEVEIIRIDRRLNHDNRISVPDLSRDRYRSAEMSPMRSEHGEG